MNNVEKGKSGESIAANYLKLHFYGILERNYRCPMGEIDIIAKKGGCIVFVEVKYRQNTSNGLPREAVTHYKQDKIRHTAQWYISSNNIDNMDFRFDVIEILGKNIGRKIEHIKDAF